HFRLGGACHDGSVGVANDNVDDTEAGAAALVALKVRSADLDAVPGAEILLDGGCQPGCGDIKRDRSRGEPPPQRGAREAEPEHCADAAEGEPAPQGPPEIKAPHAEKARACAATLHGRLGGTHVLVQIEASL